MESNLRPPLSTLARQHCSKELGCYCVNVPFAMIVLSMCIPLNQQKSTMVVGELFFQEFILFMHKTHSFYMMRQDKKAFLWEDK